MSASDDLEASVNLDSDTGQHNHLQGRPPSSDKLGAPSVL